MPCAEQEEEPTNVSDNKRRKNDQRKEEIDSAKIWTSLRVLVGQLWLVNYELFA